AAVEVGGGQGDVAQRPCAEHVFIAGGMGHREAALVVRRQDVRAGFLHHAEGKVTLAADVDAPVAGHAALVHEQLQALEFNRIQAVGAVQELVEFRVGRHQRALERLDGVSHVLEVDRVRIVRVGLLEQGDVFRQALERFFDLGRGVVHLDAGLHGAFGLFFQVGGAAVPELGLVEQRIENGRRVAGPVLPAMADRSLDVVRSAGADAVTAIATDDVTARQARLEEQPAAQLQAVRGDVALLDDGLCRGDGLEVLPCGLPHGIGGRRPGGQGRRSAQGEAGGQETNCVLSHDVPLVEWLYPLWEHGYWAPVLMGVNEPHRTLREDQVPTVPPSFFQMTTVAGRGRVAAGPSGQVETVSGSAWAWSRSGPSPGCWMLTKTNRWSGVQVMPVTSQPLGPVRKRRNSPETGSATSIWLLPWPS